MTTKLRQNLNKIDIITNRDYILDELSEAEKGKTMTLDNFSKKLISKFNI